MSMRTMQEMFQNYDKMSKRAGIYGLEQEMENDPDVERKAEEYYKLISSPEYQTKSAKEFYAQTAEKIVSLNHTDVYYMDLVEAYKKTLTEFGCWNSEYQSKYEKIKELSKEPDIIVE